MKSDDKLDGSNHDIWHLKVQFALNDGDMLDLLTSSMTALAEKMIKAEILLLLSSIRKT